MTPWPLESVLTFLSMFFFLLHLFIHLSQCVHRFLLFMSLARLSLVKCGINISLSGPITKAALSISTLVCVLGDIYLLNAASKLWHLSQ